MATAKTVAIFFSAEARKLNACDPYARPWRLPAA
jgi:hypothetical protein